jgi:hypothetical protein
MPDTYKIEKSTSYQGTATIITFVEDDGDKHEIIIAAHDDYSLEVFIKALYPSIKPDQSKFQQAIITAKPKP